MNGPGPTLCPHCRREARESRFGAPCYACVPMHPIAAAEAARDAVMGWDLAGKEGSRTCLVLQGGSPRHREVLEALAEYPAEDVFVRWEPARDARLRPDHLSDHAAFAFESTWWQDAEPPRDLGKFNCRGDYVYPAGSILGNAERVVIPASMPCASFTLTNNLSGPRLSPLPEVTSGRFDVSGTIVTHFQNAALLRALRIGQGRLNRRALRVLRPYLSKRAYRRLRGRMKENRR